MTEFPCVFSADISNVLQIRNQMGIEVSKAGCPVVRLNDSDSNLLVTWLLTGTASLAKYCFIHRLRDQVTTEDPV